MTVGMRWYICQRYRSKGGKIIRPHILLHIWHTTLLALRCFRVGIGWHRGRKLVEIWAVKGWYVYYCRLAECPHCRGFLNLDLLKLIDKMIQIHRACSLLRWMWALQRLCTKVVCPVCWCKLLSSSLTLIDQLTGGKDEAKSWSTLFLRLFSSFSYYLY